MDPISVNHERVAQYTLDTLDNYVKRNSQYLTDAPTDAVCVMDWNRCTEMFCTRYASGCPYFNEGTECCPRCGRMIADVGDGGAARIMDVTPDNEEWSGVDLCLHCAEYLDPTDF